MATRSTNPRKKTSGSLPVSSSLVYLFCALFGLTLGVLAPAETPLPDVSLRKLQALHYSPGPLSASQAVIDPIDCDSLENAWRQNQIVDTLRLYSISGQPGDTVDIPFWVKNDSILSAYAFIYRFDTTLLEPLLFHDTVIDCNGPVCDTTVTLYIWTYAGERAINGGFTTLGRYDPEYPNEARVFAVPLVAEIDSVVPGADTLAYQRFRVKSGAENGCVGTFAFVTREVWIVDTSVNPPDSTFFTCMVNEMVEIWNDFPHQVIPRIETGVFRVGATPDFACGDASGDGSLNIGDATFLISYIFSGGAAPCSSAGIGDFNCDGKLNIVDVTAVIAFIFSGGPAPCCPPGYTP